MASFLICKPAFIISISMGGIQYTESKSCHKHRGGFGSLSKIQILDLYDIVEVVFICGI